MTPLDKATAAIHEASDVTLPDDYCRAMARAALEAVVEGVAASYGDGDEHPTPPQRRAYVRRVLGLDADGAA